MAISSPFHFIFSVSPPLPSSLCKIISVPGQLLLTLSLDDISLDILQNPLTHRNQRTVWNCKLGYTSDHQRLPLLLEWNSHTPRARCAFQSPVEVDSHTPRARCPFQSPVEMDSHTPRARCAFRSPVEVDSHMPRVRCTFQSPVEIGSWPRLWSESREDLKSSSASGCNSKGRKKCF